jgi:hypothetical protein
MLLSYIWLFFCSATGKVLPGHLTSETEGYAPPNGYFEQSADCDQIMRMLMDECYFADQPKSLYHVSPASVKQKIDFENIFPIMCLYFYIVIYSLFFHRLIFFCFFLIRCFQRLVQLKDGFQLQIILVLY